MSEVKASFCEMVDVRVAQLKGQVQANLERSVTNLKMLNTTDFTAKQTLFYPERTITRLLSRVHETLGEISVFRGTHILVLPRPVLIHIIKHLPPKSILGSRLVCSQFLEAIREWSACSVCVFSAAAQRDSYGKWKILGSNAITTPTMDFSVICEVMEGKDMVYTWRLQCRSCTGNQRS
ncbi:hypothetical protein Pelo_4509 [Pelomyxa schiedti]|nr:hypothetical protein Pelo_4509 [Pelomyxa schiedti]